MSKGRKIGLPKLSLAAGSPRQSTSLLALLLGLLAAWLLWSGFRQWQAGAAETDVLKARDQIAQQATKTLAEAKKNVAAAAAVAAGVDDPAARAQAFTAAANGAQQAEVFPADLQAAYATLPGSGYGKLAVVEAVLASGKPEARIARADKGNALVAAAPLADGAVALAAYPVQALQAAVSAADASGGYLALRQGDAVVAESGDASLNGLSLIHI